MGSVAKHLNHPYDDLDLSLGDLKGMIMAVSRGYIDAVEKFDGINLHWTKLTEERNIRFARNFTDVRCGGDNVGGMITRFADHPARDHILRGIKETWKSAHDVDWTLPTDATFWVNCEMVDATNSQCIPYDLSAVVYHNLSSPNESKNGMKKVVGTQNSVFHSWCRTHPKLWADSEEDWATIGPVPVSLDDHHDDDEVACAMADLAVLMDELELNDKNTVGDIIRAKTRQRLGHFTQNPGFIDACVKAAMKEPDRKPIHKIRKMVYLSESNKREVDALCLAKNVAGWHKECLKELRMIWLGLGAYLLKDQCSSLIRDPEAAAEYLSDLMVWAEGAVQAHAKASNDPKTLIEFNNHLADFKALKVPPPLIEGIVFRWRGKSYKMTGAFASMNRVCGVPKFNLGLKYKK
jgi:hypothetical protein